MSLAADADYPLAIIVYDLFFHLAPRILKWNGLLSDALIGSKCILSGSKKSNAFARIFIHPIVRQVHELFPSSIRSVLSLFADGIAQTVFGPLDSIVKDPVYDASTLYHKLIDAKLVTSFKSIVIASCTSVSKGVND